MIRLCGGVVCFGFALNALQDSSMKPKKLKKICVHVETARLIFIAGSAIDDICSISLPKVW